jgi:hypothetical protein
MKAWITRGVAATALLLGLWQLTSLSHRAPAASAPAPTPIASETARGIALAHREAAAVLPHETLPALPADLPGPGIPAATPPLIGGASKDPPVVR